MRQTEKTIETAKVKVPAAKKLKISKEQKRFIFSSKIKRLWEIAYLTPVFIALSVFLPWYIYFALTVFILPSTYLVGRIFAIMINAGIWIFFFLWWFYALTFLYLVTVPLSGRSMLPLMIPTNISYRRYWFFYWPILYRLLTKRFDPVLLYNPVGQETEYMIKRLVAVSGDIFFIKNGYIVAIAKNGEQYVMKTPYTEISYGPVYIPGKNQIFVLGENLPISYDSRHFGTIPKSLVAGRYTGHGE